MVRMMRSGRTSMDAGLGAAGAGIAAGFRAAQAVDRAASPAVSSTRRRVGFIGGTAFPYCTLAWMKLLIHPPIEDARLSAVREAAGAMTVVNAQSPEEALREIPGTDAFFGKMTQALLERASCLRWVQSPTASLEHYIFPALVEHPCVLTNMRGLFSDVIADHVMGYVLCFARNLHVYIRQQLEACYEPVGGEAARSLFDQGAGVVSEIDRRHLHMADQTMGVIGLGAIGSEIRRRGEAFGMRVVAVDPVNPEAWPMERLDALLDESDFVVIAAPHTPKSEKMFNAARFARMKRSAYLINIGRGAIVVLNDLVDALRDGVIAGAALDVYDEEPLPQGHTLWKLPNVILTPHVAGNSPRIAERHLAVLLENVKRFSRGEPLINVANKSEWF
jgi:phosphoglycerate dehydrogenase-like enzyme